MMINFKLRPYEWQKSMEIVLENANLDKIRILDNGGIVFDFIDSYKGAFYKQIMCMNIWEISADMNLSVDEQLPLFIGDIRVEKLNKASMKEACKYLNYGFTMPESEEYNLVCINSGELSLVFVCEKFIISDEYLEE